MFYKKPGFPGENEVVLCTVKKILPNSVFVSLEEYKDKEGIIHISEIAPGRIRSIFDYVREEKKIICKVLRINVQRNNIELSLRRVSPIQITQKNAALQLEQRAEKLLEIFAQKRKTTLENMYTKLGAKLIEQYGTVNASFADILENGTTPLVKIGIDKELAQEWASLVKSSIKLPEVKIVKHFTLQSPAADGIKKIHACFAKLRDHSTKKSYAVEFHYLSAPRYSFTLKTKNYKIANAIADDLTTTLTSIAKQEKVELMIEESKKHHAS